MMLLRLWGLPGLALQGDPMQFDRWLWFRRQLHPGPGRLLDAGSGSGPFSLLAARLGNETFGISTNGASNAKAMQRATALGIERVRFVTADLRDLDRLRDRIGCFDQIACLEVIEHVLDDEKLLHDLASVLKPGGRMILSTPYEHYRRLLTDRLSLTEDGGHVRWGYTHARIVELFTKNGIEPERTEYISGVTSQLITNGMRWLRLHGMPTKLAWLVTLPPRLLVVFDRPLTALCRYPYATIGVVGVKRG